MAGEPDRLAIYQHMAVLIGQAPWDVSLGWGTFVTMDFGPREARPGGASSPTGAWHLWIQEAAWRLEQGDRPLVACEDPREDLAVAVKRMRDKRLLGVEVRLPAFDTTLTFEQGIALRLFPVTTERVEHWWFFTPDGNVLNVGPGTAWSFHSADEPRSTERDEHGDAVEESRADQKT